MPQLILPSNELAIEPRQNSNSLREPLVQSAGNINHPVLASDRGHNDDKVSVQSYMASLQSFDDYPPSQHTVYNYDWMAGGAYGMQPPSQPQFKTLPSQRFGRNRRSVIGGRKKRNPIADSPQYRAYRSRQTKNGQQKWSDVLEDLFLDALMEIPNTMFRKKFTIGDKLYGRNELISNYLWIGYKQSLPKGVEPDLAMRRSRKQVSSHIQVLEKFIKGHPDYHVLFPPKSKTPANGFEESFKDNKTLKALAAGRLPSPENDEGDPDDHEQPLFLKPCSFEMFVASVAPAGTEKFRIHDYSSLTTSPFNGSRQSIEMVRDRFPDLVKLRDLPPCVIHLNVGINMMREQPRGADLNIRVLLQADFLPQTQWKTLTTLLKPKCLSGKLLFCYIPSST